MKTKPFRLLMMATALFSIALIAACSDDDEKPTPANDRTVLAATIDRAEIIHNIAVEGTEADQYQAGSKATFMVAITSAQEIYDNPNATQGQVNSGNQNLLRAISAFNDRRVAPVEAADLIARWTFDEGIADTLYDVSGNDHNGVLTVGHAKAGGGGIPTWTTDRHGNPNRALAFTKGGHVRVPASNAFSPSELSLTVWVRLAQLSASDCEILGGRCRDGVYMDNYIVSQNFWEGYKFQTQDDRYPFFTLSTGPSSAADIAAKQNIPAATWVQLAVTVKTNQIRFYIDGVDVTKDPGVQDLTGGFGAIAERHDFVIGAESVSDVVGDISWVLSHFEGSMDDLRMYSTVLTPAQVNTIYNSEKPAVVD